MPQSNLGPQTTIFPAPEACSNRLSGKTALQKYDLGCIPSCGDFSAYDQGAGRFQIPCTSAPHAPLIADIIRYGTG